MLWAVERFPERRQRIAIAGLAIISQNMPSTAPNAGKPNAIADDLDEGCVEVIKAADIASFIEKCGELRVWAREHVVDLDS
jgi:hypothetical protein